jgi:hypothetical protein
MQLSSYSHYKVLTHLLPLSNGQPRLPPFGQRYCGPGGLLSCSLVAASAVREQLSRVPSGADWIQTGCRNGS